MPVAELIAIGTELLLGEIQDTNTRYIARLLRDNNIDLYRSSIVGDNPQRISSAIQESLKRANIVITTGGLGPTVDDPTREAAADAWKVRLEFHQELWQQIEARFLHRGITPTENNRRQAFLPASSLPIPNPVGTAPAFILEDAEHCLICLPGVPREMETLMQISVLPYLQKKYNLHGIIKARVLHVSGVGESRVDEWVSEFEALANPTVGLLAHPGIVDIRITAKADSEDEADQMIADLESIIRLRFESDIFGVDNETLPDTVLSLIQNSHRPLIWGLKGISVDDFGFTLSIPENLSIVALNESSERGNDLQMIQDRIETSEKAIGYLTACNQSNDSFSCSNCIITKRDQISEERIYNGPPAQNTSWAVNAGLDFLRRQLIKMNERMD